MVTAELMSHAKPDAIFSHCLPAHREKLCRRDVIDGPQSRSGNRRATVFTPLGSPSPGASILQG